MGGAIGRILLWGSPGGAQGEGLTMVMGARTDTTLDSFVSISFAFSQILRTCRSALRAPPSAPPCYVRA